MILTGTAALVTGAGRGLGAALARELARRGARVVLVARSKPDLDRVAAEIRAEGGEAHVLPADVGDKESVYPLAGAAVGAYPGWGAYSASKAALDHLSRVWAAELDGTGVRFLGIDPGEMNTRMHAEAMPDADPATLADPAEVAKRIARLIDRSEEVPSGSRISDLGSVELHATAVEN